METNESKVLQGKLKEFTAPSGYKFTIREQNGEDDDILSNPVTSKDLTNLSIFISAIVVNTNFTKSCRLTVEDAFNLPTNDRYAILINSRIHSLGDTVEFSYDWGKENGGKVEYEQDLNDFLFDYQFEPTEEDIASKPNAVPFYPLGIETKDLKFTTSSGKTVLFDLLNGHGESHFVTLPIEQRTKNKELIVRNLRLEVNGKFEKVERFNLFSVRDMQEIRKEVRTCDPSFSGLTDIENPITKQKTFINISDIPNFFYPGEI